MDAISAVPPVQSPSDIELVSPSGNDPIFVPEKTRSKLRLFAILTALYVSP